MPFDINNFTHKLGDAVEALDREKATALCDELIKEMEGPSLELSTKKLRNVLQDLRRKRFFWLLERVAEAYLRKIPGDQEPAEIHLQLIQALIDQGKLMEAEDELLNLVDIQPIAVKAGTEARGLLGRVHKQAYVNARLRKCKANTRRLRKAVEAYLPVYQNDPDNNWWHGINVVACLARAERDNISKSDLADNGIDWRDMAQEILQTVGSANRDSGEYTWSAATAMEACIALENQEDANQWCERYIKAPYADVFELGSTERQLREVWQLDERDTPGAEVLRIIQGSLGRLGGAMDFSASPRSLMPTDELTYQAQLGAESAVAVKWLNNLCNRSYSVAKITKDIDDTKAGTGFFIKGSDMSRSWNEKYVLMTNAHVVNERGDRSAMRPSEARIRLTRSLRSKSLTIRKVLWSNTELDTTICAVDLPEDEALKNLGLPVGRTNDVRQDDTDSKLRLYVIGHPFGDALQISLYDNYLIEIVEDKGRLRYRSPTEKGSSGSPVLSEDLEVIAIHHATLNDGTANQGVLLDAIRSQLHLDVGV
ncbi:MAG: trypsin-like peptidase domain-containing protein [Nitrospirota bacterium]|nr:MAG: trypsin-like peptidase domain-containing protein [Nitrospirota bacterium]